MKQGKYAQKLRCKIQAMAPLGRKSSKAERIIEVIEDTPLKLRAALDCSAVSS